MRYVLYGHGGSKNHGCEALVRSITNYINKEEIYLVSSSPDDDRKYQIDECCNLVSGKRFYRGIVRFIVKIIDKFSKQKFSYWMNSRELRSLIDNDTVCISIGGDNYCYGKGSYSYLIYLNKLIHRLGGKSILLGCSIEKEVLNDLETVQDLQRYDFISVRESFTHHYLQCAGLTNVVRYPDFAFGLTKIIPSEITGKDVVGINLSPLILNWIDNAQKIMANYESLIQFILEETSMSVALIPHVVLPTSDDRLALVKLYDRFKDSGRIYIIADCNCMELKGYISCCRFVVTARTHVSIAAYSTYVPTLVVGYSIKARGIARDLFGTSEHYVLDIKEMNTNIDLRQGFKWIMDHEDMIVTKLEEKVPQYLVQLDELTQRILRYEEKNGR